MENDTKKLEKVLDGADPTALTTEQRNAVELLRESMLFWRGEGITIIKKLSYALEELGDARLGLQLAKKWKDIDDRWIHIASVIAPYEASKRQSITIQKKVEHRFVIEAPRVISDKREWLGAVAEDQARIPKPQIIENMTKDTTIDEAEFNDVNAY